MAKGDKPNQKQLKKAFMEWMKDADNNPQRLVAASKIKELAKALDPDIRVDSKVHFAMLKEVGRVMIRAIGRTYDNKRSTIRPTDI